MPDIGRGSSKDVMCRAELNHRKMPDVGLKLSKDARYGKGSSKDAR